MKKRKGLFLLEALLALLILASLAAALFPLAGQAAKAEILASVRGKLENQGLFAMDFMVEKIRNNRRAMVLGGVHGNRYDYRAPTGQGTIGTYRLFEDQEKLKVQLYNDVVQPITGDRGGSVEEYVFRHPEGGHLFEQADKRSGDHFFYSGPPHWPGVPGFQDRRHSLRRFLRERKNL